MLYNVALEQRIESYNKLQKGIGYFDQKKELPLLKVEDEEGEIRLFDLKELKYLGLS